MIKCKYCDSKAEWTNPYNGMNLCQEHAVMKMKQLNEEFGVKDTLKDWFRNRTDANDELCDGSWDLKNHKIIKD